MTTQTRRNRPGTASQAAPKSSAENFLNDSPDRRIEAPTAEDRAEAVFVAEAYAHGYRLATRCTSCGRWLVADKSVRLRLGPTCRRRIGAAA
jgi:hypothetical protein